MFSNRRRLPGAVLVSLLLILPATAGAKSSPGQIDCNGSSRLCERKLNEVVLPGSHNAMSARELDWFNPNQTYSIPNQLDRGARAMLFDTYYGNQEPNGQVSNVPKAEGKATNAKLYLCHVSCRFGATDLVSELRKIALFLETHPDEVLVFINEDYVDPVDFATAVETAALDDYLYTGPAGPWPSLGEMVESNQRVVMLAEKDAAGVPWYHEMGTGPLRETPYSFENDPALLTSSDLLDESCRSGRGEAAATADSLFLMNHWISTTGSSFEPDIAYAKDVNRKEVLVDRARACEQRRGFLPNILAVDFFGTGDVIGAANQLNGVDARAKLSSGRVKPTKVRAGRRATVRVPVTNSGDAAATSVRVCAKVPRKVSTMPKCLRRGELLAGAKTVFRFRLRTKKKSRGIAIVPVKVTSSAGSYRVRAKVTIRPTARKRRQV